MRPGGRASKREQGAILGTQKRDCTGKQTSRPRAAVFASSVGAKRAFILNRTREKKAGNAAVFPKVYYRSVYMFRQPA